MITKSAYNESTYITDLVFTKSARDAWKLILKSIKHKSSFTNILLPSYIGYTEREGSGIFDPVEQIDSQFSFYKLNKDLSIDTENLQELIDNGNFNVMLIVHYFGICRNDLINIKDICEKNKIILVEDCAHAFHIGAEKETLGVTGDFSFYSVHKYLPVSTGGILKNISGIVELLPLPNDDKIDIDVAIHLLKSDIKAISDVRRKNFNLYSKKLIGILGIEVMYELREDEIPQTFPILVNDKLRESLYFYLMERNIPTIALYYRLIEPLNAIDYPVTNLIASEILNLPVHQDINDDDIEILVSELKNFYNKVK